jgi:uncharacterized membrane protein YraQ (UPF0718 family)
VLMDIATSPRSSKEFSIDKRIVWTILLVGAIACVFWFTSRIPALNEKALMAGDTELSGLGFAPLLPPTGAESFPVLVLKNSINWTATNRQGMTFGLMLAGALMTLFSLFRQPKFRGRFSNAALGMAMGSPMGVCVNCATPIAQGIYAAGGRAETMLGAMMSSPTLNFIVLAMLLSMFPLYMVAVKVSLTVAFVLLGVPLIVRITGVQDFTPESSLEQTGWFSRYLTPPALMGDAALEREARWGRGLAWVVRAFARNFWFIVRTTVPLMLLAGVLGAFLVTVLPFDTLAEVLPGDSLAWTLVAMLGVSVLGVLLPVPMAFDVILVAVLFEAGLPVKYAMVLLLTMGIFSVYPFLLLWQMVSKSLALTLLFALSGLGVVAGVGGHLLFDRDMTQQRQAAVAAFAKGTHGPMVLEGPSGGVSEPEDQLVDRLRSNGAIPTAIMETNPVDGLRVDRTPFQAKFVKEGPLFHRFLGPAYGLRTMDNLPGLSGFEPWSMFRGIAAGDVHGDGWVDVVVATDTGLRLYANNQEGGFVQQEFSIPQTTGSLVTNVALVDLNNDGWLDLFFGVFRRGLFVIYNQEGHFLEANLSLIPNAPEAFAVGASGFADLDRDGDLDAVIGNWAPPPHKSANAAALQAVVLDNTPRGLEMRALPGFGGEALSVLITDLNRDGLADVWVANDRRTPDNVLLGDGAGGLEPVKASDGLLPGTTGTSMSLAVGDVDNDLSPEIYEAQIAWGDGDRYPPEFVCAEVSDEIAHEECLLIMDLNQKFRNSGTDYSDCDDLRDNSFFRDCVASNLVEASVRNGDQASCDLLPDSWSDLAFICGYVAGNREPGWARKVQETYAAADVLEQINFISANSLFAWKDNGYVDIANDLGVTIGGWGWNAKFADLDNDEWQDLYIVNNMPRVPRRTSHYFYRNIEGRGFENATAAAGLTSYLSTRAYTYIDFDRDGDLDIITVPTSGPMWVYKNQGATGNSLTIALRDDTSNRFGIGSTITIYYGREGSLSQMREILASGGFASFDAPIAHFGLGEFGSAERIEIRWSTGERTELTGMFDVGYEYVVSRGAESGARPPQN